MISCILKEKAIKAILVVVLIFAIALPLYNIFFIYPSFKLALIQNVEDEAVRTANHLSSDLLHNVTELTKDNLPHDLQHKSQEVVRDFGIWKLKIFSATGEILYSTDPKEIGQINKYAYFYEVVAKGNPYSKLVKKENLTLERQKSMADVIETYVPIMKNGRFIGAFEIYYDITSKKQTLDILTRHYSFILSVVCIISIAIIIFLFKANKDIIATRADAEKNKAFLDSILYSSLNIAIAATDMDLRIVYFNPVAEKIIGYSASDVIGKTVLQMHALEKVDPERFQKAIENVKTKGEHKYIIEQKRDYGIHYISARVSYILDNKGRPLGYLWMASDITESIKAEETLKKSYEELVAKNKELERFQNLTVNRELKMIELKKEINALLQRLGEHKKYETPENI